MKLIKLPLKKEMSLGTWTLKRPAPPEVLRVPVYGDAPFYQEVKVLPGQAVSFGMKLAEPRGAMGVPVYCPANGTVNGIIKTRTVSGENVFAVEIQVDRKNAGAFLASGESSDWADISAERLRAQIKEKGVLLCGRQLRPLAGYLEKGTFHAKTLIINACESEPYVTAGEVLLLAHPLEIIKGVEILRRAAGLEKALIAVGANAEQAVEVLKSKIYFLKWNHIEVRAFPARYPQDDPAVLLPLVDPFFSDIEPRVLHDWPLPDIATVYAAYEAIVFGKPFFERAVTITGECVVQPQNVWLPFGIGTMDALKACKGVLREPGRMLAGGPMRGIAIQNMEQPVSAMTDALIALPKEWTAESAEADCIRCGECAEVCPVDLSPALIAAASKRQDWAGARELNAQQCLGCGNCAYVCPSHLPLVDLIQKGF
ncbi:MAG TPA: RnfABCDGE type electron transport complex subunit C [Candidatus Omnitrophota bacterium]|nr:RnfABCDGE type electron transport complex subunit C [Candidatus Omnitrophota bacterium]